MNPGLARLHPYPFEKLDRLLQDLDPPAGKPAIDLSIGEPKHATPPFILEALQTHLREAAVYPKTRGSAELRVAIADWLVRRFRLPPASLDPDRHLLPVNGTREALFAFAQCIINLGKGVPVVLSPNPFYQIYEGAALLAGAEPVYMNCTADTGFLPDIDAVSEETWRRCQLLYLCSPGNPTGVVIGRDTLARLLVLADRHDFVIAADECYSEIYFDEQDPPMGLLQAAAGIGREDYRRCLVFHSLSKRSNVPGMRSGFVAGDETLIRAFLRYRTYHGCAMPAYTQAASTLAWQDETHVRENRRMYREKFAAVLAILGPVLPVARPQAGFYLWPELPATDTAFTRDLYARQHVTVLPGSFLSRTAGDINPGERRCRIALVASPDECTEAARRIRDFLNSL